MRTDSPALPLVITGQDIPEFYGRHPADANVLQEMYEGARDQEKGLYVVSPDCRKAFLIRDEHMLELVKSMAGEDRVFLAFIS